MRSKALALLCLCAAGFLLALAVSHSPAQGVRTPRAATMCSPGFVDAIVGGLHKCLHAGECCASRYESDYERYGFTCHKGRLHESAQLPSPPPGPEPTTSL